MLLDQSRCGIQPVAFAHFGVFRRGVGGMIGDGSAEREPPPDLPRFPDSPQRAP
jgi:hypothetical protein